MKSSRRIALPFERRAVCPKEVRPNSSHAARWAPRINGRSSPLRRCDAPTFEARGLHWSGREIRPPCIELAAKVVSRSIGGRVSLSQCSLNPLRATSISAFCWRITHHNTLAVLADLLPAMARSRSSSPAAKRRHSSRGNKIAQPPSSADAAGQRLRAGRCDAHRSPSRLRWSRAWK
jgi:hypothetical protein